MEGTRWGNEGVVLLPPVKVACLFFGHVDILTITPFCSMRSSAWRWPAFCFVWSIDRSISREFVCV